MGTQPGRTPLGPREPYRPTDDLLDWMSRQFAEFGDTYKASVYGTTVYATRNPDFAYHVLVENWQNYVKGDIIKRVALLLGNGLMVTEGEVWKRQRRMIQPSFNHEALVGLFDLIRSVNQQILVKWTQAARNNESVNVTRDASAMALEVVLRFLFGEDYEFAATHFELVSEEKTRDMAFARAFRNLGKIIIQLIDRRRKASTPPSDALGIFLHARDAQGQPMKDDQLVDEVLTMVVAGHETTASTLAWAWFLLSQHPEVEKKLADEIRSAPLNSFEDLPKFPYTRQIVEETMRLYPAGWLLTRKALGDDSLGEYSVPAGIEIYLPPYFIQRHPSLWNDPDRFDPDRFRPENLKQRHRLASIPFSAGPRNCIGTHFARIEMQIHIMTIASSLRLSFHHTRPLEIDAGVNLRNKYDFMMHPMSRSDGEMRHSASA